VRVAIGVNIRRMIVVYSPDWDVNHRRPRRSYEMLAEAVRNSQAENERLEPKAEFQYQAA
jgi:hypothetical protein